MTGEVCGGRERSSAVGVGEDCGIGWTVGGVDGGGTTAGEVAEGGA